MLPVWGEGRVIRCVQSRKSFLPDRKIVVLLFQSFRDTRVIRVLWLIVCRDGDSFLYIEVFIIKFIPCIVVLNSTYEW